MKEEAERRVVGLKQTVNTSQKKLLLIQYKFLKEDDVKIDDKTNLQGYTSPKLPLKIKEAKK